MADDNDLKKLALEALYRSLYQMTIEEVATAGHVAGWLLAETGAPLTQLTTPMEHAYLGLELDESTLPDWLITEEKP